MDVNEFPELSPDQIIERIARHQSSSSQYRIPCGMSEFHPMPEPMLSPGQDSIVLRCPCCGSTFPFIPNGMLWSTAPVAPLCS